MSPTFTRALLGLSFGFLIASCGGSSKNERTAGIDGSGAPVTTAVAGPINGFGSVIIGGIHYDSRNAVITVNGQPGSEADLGVGSYIILQGQLAADGKQGVATSISFQPNVSGAITTINDLAESFVIAGQTVLVSNDTSFDFAFSPRNITGLSKNQNVEVSGPVDAAGQIIATRISLSSRATTEIAGPISHLNSQNKTFNINQQLVNYSKLVNVPVLQEGQEVILHNAELAGVELNPQQIAIAPGVKPLTQAQTLMKSGVITRFTSLTDFYVGDLPVTTNSATQYLDAESTALGQNVKIMVSGHVIGGKLLADTIQWLADTQWQMVGAISQIDALNTSGGRILVENTWIKLNASTRLDSEFAGADNRMKLASLHVGDRVVLTGRSLTGEWLAASLEREELIVPQLPQQVRGTVKHLDQAQGSFRVLTYQISTTSNTQYWRNGQTLSAQNFYSAGDDQLVEVRGVLEGTKLQATSIKILNARLGGNPQPSTPEAPEHKLPDSPRSTPEHPKPPASAEHSSPSLHNTPRR